MAAALAMSIYFHFSVVFKNQQCLDCGLSGDVRLMSNHCHMAKEIVHPDELIQYRPMQTEKYHEDVPPITDHPKGLIKPWYSVKCCGCFEFGDER